MFTFTFTFATMSCLASVSTFAQLLYLFNCSPTSTLSSPSAWFSTQSTRHIPLQRYLPSSSQIKHSIPSIYLTITNRASHVSRQARLLGACLVLLHHLHPGRHKILDLLLHHPCRNIYYQVCGDCNHGGNYHHLYR
jgi:hypothetical protein